jgi:hypothetical protein
MVATSERTDERRQIRLSTIDCDIHVNLKGEKVLGQYMSEHWRRFHESYGARGGDGGGGYPRQNPHAARTDSWPPNGGPPASDLPFLREQLLDGWGIEYGILNPLLAGGGRNLEYAAARCSAVNDWQIDTWLDPEPRLRGSICVPHDDGELAAAEVDRLGDDPRFVQALLTIRTREPLGRRKYWKLYEAALHHGLPVGVHFGGNPGGPITGGGWPSFYYEDHAGNAQAFQAQLISLVCEGVFERFPDLKFVLIEGGFGWLPSLERRLDMAWRRLKDEVPHVKELPSTYVRRNVWLTTQPMEEPTDPRHFPRLIEQFEPDRLMFATDYPHWDFDAPGQAFPTRLPEDTERRIMSENARALYRFGAAR